LAERHDAREGTALVVGLAGLRAEPLHTGPDRRVARERLSEIDHPHLRARDHADASCTSATAPATPREWLIERSATVSPRRSADASVRPESLTAGWGRPTISISRQEKSTPQPSALPTASL